MQQVTQNEFFAALNADPRDIMPVARLENGKCVSEWREKDKPWSPLWGTSAADGYPNGIPATKYFLVASLKQFHVHNPATMHEFGIFRAPNAEVALDVLAKDMGHKNYTAAAMAGVVAVADEIAEAT